MSANFEFSHKMLYFTGDVGYRYETRCVSLAPCAEGTQGVSRQRLNIMPFLKILIAIDCLPTFMKMAVLDSVGHAREQ